MKKTHKKNHFTFLTIASFILLILVPFSKTLADTYLAGPNNDILVTVNLDHGLSYGLNDDFSVTGSVTPPLSGNYYIVDMSVIADGIFARLLNPQALGSYPIFNTLPVVGATETTGLKLADFSTGVEDEEPVINPNNGSCIATLTFQGAFRHGSVVYNGPAVHPQLTVGITEVGYLYPTPGSMTGERPAMYPFIIPANTTQNWVNGHQCSVSLFSGCEIEGVGGFDHAYVSSVTPNSLGGGRICVEQEPAIPGGCRYPNDAPGVCWQKPAGWQCSTFQSPNGVAEDC